MRGTDDTHDDWQPLSLATDRLLLAMTNDDADANHRNNENNSEERSDKDASAELEIIEARLRFLNLIEAALQRATRQRK